MIERPIDYVNPEWPWHVQVRRACEQCDGTGKKKTSGRGVGLACLACGDTGYHTYWMKLSDFIDVFDWRRKRDEIAGGGMKEKLDAINFILEHGKNFISPTELKRLQIAGCILADAIVADLNVKFCDLVQRPS